MLQCEARKVDAKTSPAEASMDSALNPIDHIITTLINASSGATSAVSPERRCIECCASGYPELKSLQYSSNKRFYFSRPGIIAMDCL